MRRPQTGEERGYSRYWSQRRLERLAHPDFQVGKEMDRKLASLRSIVLQHRRDAAAQEQLERLGELEPDAARRQRFGKALTAQQLAVDEDAVAVEDDQVQVALAELHRTIRAYAHREGNSSGFSAKSLADWIGTDHVVLPLKRLLAKTVFKRSTVEPARIALVRLQAGAERRLACAWRALPWRPEIDRNLPPPRNRFADSPE